MLGNETPIDVGKFELSSPRLVTVVDAGPDAPIFATNSGQLLYPSNITFAARPVELGTLNLSIEQREYP